MEALASIQRQFLEGQQLMLQGAALQAEAFNRLLQLQAPVITVAMAVRAELVED